MRLNVISMTMTLPSVAIRLLIVLQTSQDGAQAVPIFEDPEYESHEWVYDMINIQPVWEKGIFGRGVRVRINDSGVESTHPEFAGRFDVDGSCDNYEPRGGNTGVVIEHGTSVAGIVGGSADNGVCSAGIAPEVTISACFAFDFTPSQFYLGDKLDAVDISQNSHGTSSCIKQNRRKLQPGTCPFTFSQSMQFPCDFCDFSTAIDAACETQIISHCAGFYQNDVAACADFLDLILGRNCNFGVLLDREREALVRGVTEGRDGKGVVFVFAAGNSFRSGDDTNLRSFTSSRFVISVGAVDKDSKHAVYSTPGATLFVTAPGVGHITADLQGGCSDPGAGTSFSSPVVSGIVALMLQVRPDLTYRDVQGILASTSKRIEDPDDATAFVNQAGFWHSNFYGFGLVDAAAAVEMAEAWESIGPEQMLLVESETLNLPIEDKAEDGSSTIASASLVLESLAVPKDFMTESVVVQLDLQYVTRGHLEISLTSPQGTRSILSPGSRPENNQLTAEERWKLNTVRNLGESPTGEWTLSIVDTKEGDASECVSAAWEVVTSGTAYDCADLETQQWCKDGEEDPTGSVAGISAEFYEFFFGTVYEGRTAAEACCACGGGIDAEEIVNQLTQWSLVVYGYQPTEDNVSPDPSIVPTQSPSASPSTSDVSPDPSIVPTQLPSASPSTSDVSPDPSIVPTQLPSASPSTSDQGNEGSDILICNQMGDAISCLDVDGCFWCNDKEVCRRSFRQCPGNDLVVGKLNTCAPLKNEAECTDIDECFWCDDKELCRASEEECPGQGRDNPCRESETLDDCTAKDECDWLEQAEMCVGARGAGGIVDGNNGQNNQTGRDVIECPLLANEGTCSRQNTCRWCPSDDECKSVSDRCEDGSLGDRGNACRVADTELCGDVLGCLWCVDAGICAKAGNDACKIDADDPLTGRNSTESCGRQDAGPECSEIEGCQWCGAQSKCKQSQARCFAPSGDVDLGLTKGRRGAFKIRDDGLGSTDPNAVSVVLSYLYEIDGDGVTIDASLVDLEFQEFEVTQVIGTFFEDIEARRFTFGASIEGVGNIEMTTYLMLSNGTISTGTEEWAVQAGDVKFNIELSDWTFCGAVSPCGTATESGEFIDLAFHINGKADSPEQSEDDALLFNLGGNIPLLLSNQVEVDTFMQEMPDGFPRAESTEGQGTVFVFRFPRFEDTAVYDPVIPFHTSFVPVGTDDATDDVTSTTSPTKVPVPVPSPPPTVAPMIKTALETKSSNDDDSLSGGAMAGIIIGSILGLCLCCAVVGVALKRRGSSSSGSTEEKNTIQDDDHLFEDEAKDEAGAAFGGDDEEDDEGDDDDDRSGEDEEDEEEESEDGDEENKGDDSEEEYEEDRSLV